MVNTNALTWLAERRRDAAFILLIAALAIGAGVVGFLTQTKMEMSGGTLIQMDTRALTRSATMVVIGDIISQTPRASDVGIVTDSVVRVVETLRGSAPSTVVVTARGGRVGNTIAFAHDGPALRTGARVLLFLVNQPGSELGVVGGFQGAYEFSGDAASNEGRVVPLTVIRDEVRNSP